MRQCVNTSIMRASDAATIAGGVPSVELMRRAAQGIFDRVDWHGKIVILCGKGNNGGDGLALAEILIDHGFQPQVYLYVMCSLSPDAWYYLQRLERIHYKHIFDSQEWDGQGDIIVDCLLGTGFRGEVRGDMLEMITQINQSDAYVVSADIPSGLNGDNGIATHAVHADLTIAIGTEKVGYYLNDGKDHVGRVETVDIGIPIVGESMQIVTQEDVLALFPPRKHNSHKGTYGRTLLVGGSVQYTGAAMLAGAAQAALRVGCGLCAVAAPKECLAMMQAYSAENTWIPLASQDGCIRYDRAHAEKVLQNIRAVGIGMGLGDRYEQNLGWIEHLLHRYSGMVLMDADALNTIARTGYDLREHTCDLLITPHAAEMARLCNCSVEQVLADPIGTAKNYALHNRCCVLLKGPTTVVTDGKQTLLVVNGTPALAKGGSGDTLSGVCVGLAGRCDDWAHVAAAGAYLCASAAEQAAQEYGEYGVLASDVARTVARWVREKDRSLDE